MYKLREAKYVQKYEFVLWWVKDLISLSYYKMFKECSNILSNVCSVWSDYLLFLCLENKEALAEIKEEKSSEDGELKGIFISIFLFQKELTSLGTSVLSHLKTSLLSPQIVGHSWSYSFKYWEAQHTILIVGRNTYSDTNIRAFSPLCFV